MHGFVEQSKAQGVQSDEQQAQNFAVLSSYVDFDHYNVWVPAGAWVNSAASTTTLSANDAVPVRVFADAATNTVTYSFRRPRMWINGVAQIRLHYTGSANSTNNFRIECGIQVNAENASTPASATTAQNVPGPATAGLHLITRLFETSANTNAFTYVDYADDLISVTITRSGAHLNDTYAGEFQLIGAEVYYTELKTSPVGRRYRSDKRSVAKD